MLTAVLEQLEEMQRLERCFMTPKGEVDLMDMAIELPADVFRQYVERAREWRATRRRK